MKLPSSSPTSTGTRTSEPSRSTWTVEPSARSLGSLTGGRGRKENPWDLAGFEATSSALSRAEPARASPPVPELPASDTATPARGVKRRAAFGTATTPYRSATSILAVAVMPGRSLAWSFGTSSSVS